MAEFFVKVKTAEEVREYNGAFLQLYREEAFYLERTVHYLQRVGMEHIKKAVLEDPRAPPGPQRAPAVLAVRLNKTRGKSAWNSRC